jgi:Trypsin-like peptidase domain
MHNAARPAHLSVLAVLAGAALTLCGCASAGSASSGFIDRRLALSFIPIYTDTMLVVGHWEASGLAVAPGIAVTNDHNYWLIPAEARLAQSRDYDLMFFRTAKTPAPLIARARLGEAVVAYGTGARAELRQSRGIVAGLDVNLPKRCPDCPAQHVLAFDAPAGGGFSGGPVVDAKTGAVLGITFGYLDGQGVDGGRRMYAYDMGLVMAEMRRLLGTQP